MGRIFEKRKHTMFARFDRMAKAFTKIGKEIAIAVKSNGPDPDNNARLRIAIQNAKGANMPKDRVDAAIKRAVSRDKENFEEATYEAYGPHGVGIFVETATDNTTRTVANVRMHLSRHGRTLATTGALESIFIRKGVFKINPEGLDLDTLELELIDAGLEEMQRDEDAVFLTTAFTDFGNMQKALEARKINVISSELQRVPNLLVECTEEQEKEVLDLVEDIESDDDVQNVYHNLK
ncbi:MAG: YebC/PmpR family DNA-binding transcriptional regulator [Bacteroidetes bacterium]|nr:YebC/PmpR family DNA-binding transcriptional regulator [Bacteroidota bacterium]